MTLSRISQFLWLMGAFSPTLAAENSCTKEKVDACTKLEAEPCKQRLRAVCAEIGLGLYRQDKDRALFFLNQACRLELEEACRLLGEHAVTNNQSKKAKVYFLAGCQHGGERSCFKLGSVFADEGDMKAAKVYLKIGCLRDHAESCGRLHKLLQTRKKASEPRALNPLAKSFIESHFGKSGCLTPTDCQKRGDTALKENSRDIAVSHFRRGCEFDDFASCHRAAWLLQQDDKLALAIPMYEKACRGGEPKACNNLGWRYERIEDRKTAKSYYDKACRLGHARACSRRSAL